MTTQEINNTIGAINHIIANNNPVAASAVLKQYYPTDVSATPDQVEKALNVIYASNTATYIAAMKRIPYLNSVNNWTTSAQTKQNIVDIAKQVGVASASASAKNANTGSVGTNDVSSFFGNIVGSLPTWLGGSTVTTGNITTTNLTPAISPTTLAIIIVIILAFLALILWLFVFRAKGSAS